MKMLKCTNTAINDGTYCIKIASSHCLQERLWIYRLVARLYKQLMYELMYVGNLPHKYNYKLRMYNM